MELTLYEDFKTWAYKNNWFNTLSYKEVTLTYYEWLSPLGVYCQVRVSKKGFLVPFLPKRKE